MSEEEEVLQRYPHAEAQYQGAAFEQGQLASTQGGTWAVFPSGGLGHAPIGKGATEDQAWQAAAAAVKKESRTAETQLWVHFLLKQGYEWSKEDRNVLVNPSDPEDAGTINTKTGQFMAMPKLMQRHEKAVDSNGRPPA